MLYPLWGLPSHEANAAIHEWRAFAPLFSVRAGAAPCGDL